MIFHRYVPQAPLSDFVDLLWLYHGYRVPHAKERLLPDGTTELVFNLHEDRIRLYDRDDFNEVQHFRGSVICGAQSRYFVIDTAGETSTVGVHFKPGGAFPFFNLPINELHNEHVSLETLWGRTADDIRNQLLEAQTADAKLRVLEGALLNQAAKSLERHPAVAYALNEFRSVPQTRKISEVTDRTGFSPRRFIQVFNEQVGLTPKLFCRVRRFQKVLGLIQKAQPVDWADMAVNCGYYDQAHFVHDFQAFSGLSPTIYQALHTEHFNHVPIPD